MYIYHKQCGIIQKIQWKGSNGQLKWFNKATSGALCWKRQKTPKLGKLKCKLLNIKFCCCKHPGARDNCCPSTRPNFWLITVITVITYEGEVLHCLSYSWSILLPNLIRKPNVFLSWRGLALFRAIIMFDNLPAPWYCILPNPEIYFQKKRKKTFWKGMTYPGWYHGKGHVQSIPKMLQFLRIRDFKPWLSAVKVRSNSEKNIAGMEALRKKDTATIFSSWVWNE